MPGPTSKISLSLISAHSEINFKNYFYQLKNFDQTFFSSNYHLILSKNLIALIKLKGFDLFLPNILKFGP